MAQDRNQLEFERIRNLVQGFGWAQVKTETTDSELIMVLTKKRETPIAGTEGMPKG